MSSFHSRPGGSSVCNLIQMISANDSENSNSECKYFRVPFLKNSHVSVLDCRKLKICHWISVCSWIVTLCCILLLVFVTSAKFGKESRDDESVEFVTNNSLHIVDAENERLNADSVYHQTSSKLNESVSTVTQLGCGGFIQVPQDGTPIILNYKAQQKYNNNENCLWVLNTVSANERYAVDLKVRLVYKGFSDPEDTVSILNWYNFDFPYLLRKEVDIIVKDSYWILLSFSTNGAVNEYGFMIQLEATRTGRSFRGSNWAFTTPNGHFRRVYSKKEDWSGVVINPKSNALSEDNLMWKLSGTFDDANTTHTDGPCKYYGSLLVYPIGLKGEITKIKTLCHKASFDVYSDGPILVGYIFSSMPGGSFTLQWG